MARLKGYQNEPGTFLLSIHWHGNGKLHLRRMRFQYLHCLENRGQSRFSTKGVRISTLTPVFSQGEARRTALFGRENFPRAWNFRQYLQSRPGGNRGQVRLKPNVTDSRRDRA